MPNRVLMIRLTQAQFDTLAHKDSDTIYFTGVTVDRFLNGVARHVVTGAKTGPGVFVSPMVWQTIE